MNSNSKENKILLRRLAYFFKHFKPEQKKIMADSVDEFLAEPTERASHSKSLSKILDFLTKKVFKPIGKFGRPIPLNKQSPQIQKKRRDKMKPSFMLFHESPEGVKRRIRRSLDTPRITRRRRTTRSKGKKLQIENDR
jgi:hypothetical protein